MTGGDNSAKRDRLQIEDREVIKERYSKTNVYPMSWYSKLIWEHILKNYQKHPERVSSYYRDALKQNMANFMYILWCILEKCHCGEEFLENKLLSQHYKCFNYSYSFNENGEIISTTPRHFTDRNQDEMKRYKRIAFDSVYDFQEKENRNTKNDLNKDEQNALSSFCKELSNSNYDESYKDLVLLVEQIEKRISSHL